MTTSIFQRINPKILWLGNKSLKKGVRHLLWSVFRFFLSDWLWGMAIRLVAMPKPYKNAGVVIAFAGLALFIWGIWGIWLSLRNSGLKGLCLIVGVYLFLLFIFNLLTYQEPVPIQERLLPVFANSITQFLKPVSNFFKKLANAPEDFRFAYTGSNAGEYLAGFPTPIPDNIIKVDALPASQNVAHQLEFGGYVLINIQNGSLLDCRSGPALTFPISVSFHNNIRLLILDGPKIDEQENRVWWKLHGDQDDGWCEQKFLTPIQ